MKNFLTPNQKRKMRSKFGIMPVKVRGKSRPVKVSMINKVQESTLRNVSQKSDSLDYSFPSCSKQHSPGSHQSYADIRTQVTEQWRNVEPRLLTIAINNFHPSCNNCVVCNIDLVDTRLLRCEDCGLQTYYCEQCWLSTHKHVWYHMPDIFKNGMFVKYNMPLRTMMRQDRHVCSSGYIKMMIIVDGRGLQHQINVSFCKCETEPETLLRHNLWACSVISPKVAVSVSLLEWHRTFQLEQHISTTGFCESLLHQYMRTPGYTPFIKNLSRILLKEVVESYRHHVYQLQHVQGVYSSTIDDGTSCPACFGNSTTTRMYSIDANFGLVRRRAAGLQSCDPHHQSLFFGKQENVDYFVSSFAEPIQPTIFTNCSDFQAGNELRSRGKNKKLDVKGVIGACCKHEYPRLFVNLKHGERLEYAVWLIKEILQTNDKLKIFYDIACKLKAHLQIKKDEDLLKRIDFAVPVFHGYAHNMTCQLQFSPRRQFGFGLTEGETMERLWSYLRNFHKVTKEMKPEHRHDLLNDALLHYGTKLKMKLGKTLCKRLDRAKTLKEDCLSNLNSLMSCSSSSCAADFSKMAAVNRETTLSAKVLSWEEKYAYDLHRYYSEKNLLDEMNPEDECRVDKVTYVTKLECTLARVERENRIEQRWLPISFCYTSNLGKAVIKMRSNLWAQAQKESLEKFFFSSLIKKYPMGQSICNRILKGQKRVTNNIRQIINKYNKLKDVETNDDSQHLPRTLAWSDLVVSSATTEQSSGNNNVFDVLQMICRADEEIGFLKEEMSNTLNFYQNEVNNINELLAHGSKQEQAYLKSQAYKMEVLLKKTYDCFDEFLPKFYLNTPVLREFQDDTVGSLNEENSACYESASEQSDSEGSSDFDSDFSDIEE